MPNHDWEALSVELQDEVARLQFELSTVQKEYARLIDRCSLLELNNSDLEEKLEELEDSIEELEDENEELEEEVLEFESPSSRRPPPHFKLPDERTALTHKFKIGLSELGHGYLTCGMYPDSHDLGEIFIKMRKESEDHLPDHLKNDSYVTDLHRTVSELTAFLRGVLDQLAIAVSVGLQRGIPLEVYASKYKGTRFPPDGRTENRDIPYANSIVDYIFRWLGQKFIGTEEWLPPKRGE